MTREQAGSQGTERARESTPPREPTQVVEPAQVDEWYRRFGGVGVGASPAELRDGGIRAIREAIARPGRDREGAFALLAADGLLTRAVEAHLEDEDPEIAFGEILGLLGREGREEGG